jgi:hypothetical protein
VVENWPRVMSKRLSAGLQKIVRLCGYDAPYSQAHCRAISFGPICLAGTCSGWDEQCLQNSTSRTIPRSSFWVPVGETPTMHAFTASGASTFDFLPDAVIHAQKEAAHRPEQPWISTSDVLFGPDQIRVLYATITAEEAS